MAVKAGTVYVDVRPNTAGFAAQLQGQMASAGAAAGATVGRTFSQKLTRAGAGLSAVGRNLTRYVSLPLAAAGAASVKMALDFDRSFTTMNTLAGVSRQEIAGLKEEVLDLSGTTAQAPLDLAKSLYFIRSSGFEGAAAMDILTVSAKAAAAGLGDTTTVADAVTSAMNAYGPANLKAAEATDTLIGAVREGKGEASEIGAVIGRVIPLASELGVTFQDVGAATASMTLAGLDAAEATTALRGIFTSLLKPTADGVEQLEKMGLSVGELRKGLEEDGLLNTLVMLKGELGNNKEAMADIFPNVRALAGFLNLTGQRADENAKIFNELAGAVGETDKAFSKAQKGAGFKFDKVLNDLRIAAVELGTELLPVITEDIIPAISSAIEWFQKLSPATKDLAVKLGLLAIVAGPLLRLAGALTRLTGSLVGAAGALTRVASAAVKAGAIGRLAGPIGLAAIAVHDLHAAFKGFEDDGIVGHIQESLSGWGADLLRNINPTAGALVDILGDVAGAFRDVNTTVTQGKDGFDIKGLSETMGQMRRFNVTLSANEQALFDAYVANGQYGSALDVLKRKLAEARGQLRNMQTATQRQKEAAADAEQQHRGMASSVKASGDAAHGAAGDFNELTGKVKAVPPAAQIHVSAPGLAETSRQFSILNAAVGAIDTSITIAVNAIGNAAGQLHSGGLVRHAGGPIPSMHRGGVRRDERVVLAQAGEYMMRREAVNRIGIGTLNALNKGGGGGSNAGAPKPVELRITNWGAGRKAIHADLVWANSMRGW